MTDGFWIFGWDPQENLKFGMDIYMDLRTGGQIKRLA